MRFRGILQSLLIVGCIASTTPMLFGQERDGDGRRPGREGGGGGRGGMRMGFGMGGGGLSSLLMMKEVREELKVSDEQAEELQEFQRELGESMRGQFQPGQQPDFTKMRENMVAMQKKIEAKLEEVLDPMQLDRLLGLYLQNDTVRAVSSGLIAGKLKITDEQKTKIEEVEKAAGEEMRGMFSGGPPGPEMREKFAAIRKSSEEKTMAILTEEQKKEIETLKGEKFNFPAPQFGPGGIGGPGGGRGGPGGGRGGRGGRDAS